MVERTSLLPRFIAAENNLYAISIYVGNVHGSFGAVVLNTEYYVYPRIVE